MQKFFIPNACMDGTNAVITGQDARHIHKVLRLKPGAPLCLTNGKGMDFDGRILAIAPDRVDVSLTSEHPSVTESSLLLTVCCAMLKDKKMDLMIKHLTQLGIVEWIPFFCERAIPTPDAKRLSQRVQRWETIAGESIKQCRRSCLVAISQPRSFREILDLSDTFHRKIAFWEKSSRALARLEKSREDRRVMLLIGPEGGFTDQEIDLAQAKGFDSYSLGPRILRAETAAICATTLIQHLLGDM